MDVDNEQDVSFDEIEKLKSFSSPGKLIKKAFSSFLVVLMISAGLVINWILAICYLIICFSSVSSLWLTTGLLLLIIVFPFLYLFFAYSYGHSILLWEAYRVGIRPVLAKMFSRSLDKFLVDNPDDATALNESEIVKDIEERQKHFLERLPNFISAYYKVFFTSNDIIKIVKEQRASGVEKEAVKKKAMVSFFESLDLQMSELMEPSLIYFYILGSINVLILFFLF